MEATQTQERKPSFESVWAMLEKISADIDRNIEADKKRAREADRAYKRMNKRLGLYDNSFGKMLEHMVKPNLIKSFRKLGFNVTKAHQNTRIVDEDENTIAEVDFTLEDGDKVILVEVKSRLTTEDITYHAERIRKVKAHADQHGDKREYLGAIAGVVVNDIERDFALKSGFYLIQPSGKTFNITVPESLCHEK